MKTLLSLLFTWLLLANNCASNSQSTQQEPQQTHENFPPLIEKEKAKAPKGIENQEGWEEFEGNRILKGELYTSKGAILGIEEVFIDSEYKTNSNNKKLPELRPLVGKTLEIKGDVYIYHCGTMEQCLTQGYMKWLRNVEYVKVIE